MAKFVFLNIPGAGHVNPTLALVQELISRGQEVSYYLTEEYRDSVQATGATFHPYTSKRKDQMTIGPSSSVPDGFPLASMGPMLAEEARDVPPQIRDRIRMEQPDAILYDFLCVWAHSILEELHVPAISTRATYASNEHFHLFEQMRENMAKNPGMSGVFERLRKTMGEQAGVAAHPAAHFFEMFSRVEPLNIVFLPREFQPAGETFDERFLFVGPSILPRYPTVAFPFDQLKQEGPLLYISLGSMLSNQLDFYQVCFDAFGGQPWQVVLSIGKHTDQARLGPVPDNFVLSPYVPQLDVLPRTNVFVTHAGTNSIMESLYYGVPMVLLPQQPEQQLHAQRTQELGAGLMLDKATLTAPMLRETVERVAQDASYQEHAQHMQRIVRAAGGQELAANAIIQFIETHGRYKFIQR